MPTPKPTPTKIKELRGNPGRRSLNKSEPEYSKVKCEAPAILDAEGKAEWNRIVEEMRETGVLTKMDEGILLCYCEEYSTLINCLKELRKPKSKSLIMKSPSGYPIQNPYISLKRKSIQILKGLAGELGLSPASRSRVTAAPTKPTDDKMSKLKKEREARLIEAREKFKKNKK